MNGDRVDLDQLQRKLDADQTLDDWPDYEAVKAAVAELRVARRVLDLERPLSRPHCSPSCACERNQAWLAYEQVTA
jgi:hypothetical protein